MTCIPVVVSVLDIQAWKNVVIFPNLRLLNALYVRGKVKCQNIFIIIIIADLTIILQQIIIVKLFVELVMAEE